ncbi:Lectin receptor kinase [Quillaja saponaria]|uniref:non-specific serine/threonine protein kinase n=1 Tax=Quillaja saponaria TaxID=32244 RepID=A0AAD7PU52_QUISA|nr:Lectin receptor kinase [Quillaja saponaria]
MLKSILILLIIPYAASLSFNFSSFNQGDVMLKGDSYFQASDIQLTLNAIDLNKNYSFGRAIASKQMHLWDSSSGNLTDFSTKFSFVLYAQNMPYADGMAFFLADPNLPIPVVLKQGGGLGVVDGNQTLNSTDFSFVAVEFDTFKNLWDPNGTHVGININSMRNGTSVEQRLEYNADLRNYLPEWVTVGFSAATGVFFEINTLQSWSFSSNLEGDVNATSPSPPAAASPIPISDPGSESKVGLKIGLGIGVSVVVICLGTLWFLLWRKRKRGKEEDLTFDLTMDDEFERGTGPKRFSYNELVHATKNFTETEKLGQGGFGGVYRGFLRDLNSYVAIKRVSKESRQGIKEYATEVKIISQLRHRNLVQLIGWCHQKNDFLLIYEFMPNGSLDAHLFSGKSFLTWQVRYNIAQGLASALLYLHEEWERCVLHRDIKSSNIMLDSSFNPKLGDFGLARLVDHGKGSQTTVLAGTMGYMAPECLVTGKSSKESDIFSFGIVALEITCGRKPIDSGAKEGQIRMLEWVWELYGTGKLLEAADPKLCGEFNKQEMEHLMIVGLWCAHPDYIHRPSVRQAIHVLNFEAPLPILPPKMPVPTYLPPQATASLSSIISSSYGATAFEIEQSQSSSNNLYTGSSQSTTMSSASSSSTAALLHTHPNLPVPVVDGNQTLNSTEFSFVAVEFDTFQNVWDQMIAQKLEYNVDLRNYLPEWVTFGFSAATGFFFEVHTLQSWSFSSNLEGDESKAGLKIGLGIGISVLVICLGTIWFLLWKKRKRGKEEYLTFDLTMDDKFEKGTGPKKFAYSELVYATKNFAGRQKLGQGGFGGVYRGFLRDLNSYVAIRSVSEKSRQGIKEYATEVKIISQLRHRNLVRYNIAQGLASVLLYLHEEWERCVLHGDIKSSNIMLDSSFNPKLGDFGLARLVDHGKGSQTTVLAGTMGYMAPECFITGKSSKESDIFSFGIVAWETACGRKPIDSGAKEGQIRMLEWVWELY